DRRPARSATIVGLHAQLHRTLTARADLGIPDADRADVAVILGCLKPPIALDLERGYLEIGDPGESPAPDLGATPAQPFVEEQGAARVVGQQRGDRSILAE